MSVAEFLPARYPSDWSSSKSRRSLRLESAVSVPLPASETVRHQVTAAARTIVVKVGTRVLTQAEGTLNYERIEQLAEEIHAISQDGRRAAQVLLTLDDVDDRIRYLNVRNTLVSILEFGAVPIVNENDTVSVEELKTTFGDNDRLAAMVTNLIRAPLLVVLSDIAGLYDGDPSLPGSQLVSTVEKIDERVLSFVRDRKTGLSKGGMASKLEAARIVTSAGESMIIASGRQSGVLAKIMAAETLGTLFLAQGKGISQFKRWLGFSAQVRGRIQVDGGARQAIIDKGRSLLAAGVVGTQGEFQKGDVVALCDAEGQVIARGLSNYSSADVERIKGLKSDKIAQVLGLRPYEEVIHRDNLTLVQK